MNQMQRRGLTIMLLALGVRSSLSPGEFAIVGILFFIVLFLLGMIAFIYE